MDPTVLASIEAALSATPDNFALLGVVLQGAIDAEDASVALRVLQDRTPADVPEATRRDAARALLALGKAAEAVAWTGGDAPETQLIRARVLLEEDRVDEARAAYQSAVAANPTLEDTALAASLVPRDRVVKREDSPTLRLLADGGVPEEPVNEFSMSRSTVTFADVGGLDALKKRIHKRIILPLIKPGLFARFRRKSGGGVLMYGPPGCGKTLLARATAGETKSSFINVAISDVLDMYMGQSEQKLHDLFERARAERPSVMFFDEVEALGGKRQQGNNHGMAKLVSQFLTELDGFAADNDKMLILAATNVPWAVDPAFRRPGRFDRVVFVPPPDRPARAVILALHLEGRPQGEDVDVDEIAQRSSWFSGADLLNLVETAADLAIDESLESGKEVPIRQVHLLEAFGDVRPTTREWLTTARNYARYANEAGQYDEVLSFINAHGKNG